MIEAHYRRPGFRPGTWLCIADGRLWAVPPPPAGEGAPPQYRALVAALADEPDPRHRWLGELALLIELLGQNYALGRGAYVELLAGPAPSPGPGDWLAAKGARA